MLPTDIDPEMLKELCPHCQQGNAPRYRSETDELVHDLGNGNRFVHTLCFGTAYMRKQRKLNG